MSKKSSYHKLRANMKAIGDAALRPSDKIVYALLVWRLKLDTGQCFPSVSTIAVETCLGERAVRGCLKRLEDAGYIKRLIQPGRTKSNRYLIYGLNAERTFPKTGTQVPSNRNGGAAYSKKENKKEREAGEGKGEHLSKWSTKPDDEISKGASMSDLAEALGGPEQGWRLLQQLPDDLASALDADLSSGRLGLPEAIAKVKARLPVQGAA